MGFQEFLGFIGGAHPYWLGRNARIFQNGKPYDATGKHTTDLFADNAIEFIKSIKPAQLDGSEDKDITLKFGGKDITFKGMQYLLGFSLPHFYFHVTTAYNILRHNGVEIGKRDFMGAN